MTPEQIIKSALDGTFRRVYQDGTYGTETVDRDSLPYVGPHMPQKHVEVRKGPRRRVWTEEMDQRLIELRAAKVPVLEISILMCCSHHTISARLAALVEQGRIPAFTKRMRPSWKQWSPEMIARVEKMRADKMTREYIAAKLNVSVNMIGAYVQAQYEIRRATKRAA